MGKVTDFNEKFEEYFHELEGFGLRSERFFEDMENSKDSGIFIDWLKAAYWSGVRDAAKDAVETLDDYGTALAGCIGEKTLEESYTDAAKSLAEYFEEILEGIQ